jgi:hypothetical protein
MIDTDRLGDGHGEGCVREQGGTDGRFDGNRLVRIYRPSVARTRRPIEFHQSGR